MFGQTFRRVLLLLVLVCLQVLPSCAQHTTTVAQPAAAVPAPAQPGCFPQGAIGPHPGNIGMPGNAWRYSPYYYRYQYGPTFPTCGAPAPVAGRSGFFRIGSFNCRFWLSPSGYYYPWGCGQVFAGAAPIYYLDQGVSTPSRPPLSSVLSDLEKFLQDSKSKGKLQTTDYDHLVRRLRDLRFKQERMINEGAGVLDPADDDSLRADIDRLSGEVSRSMAP